jgi:hypothetical protein
MMRFKTTAATTTAGILLSVLALAGCSANPQSMAGDNRISIEKQNSEKVKILWSDVYLEDGRTWVHGVLKQQNQYASAVKIHVDIQVLSEDSSVHYETISDDLYVPRKQFGKGPNWVRFKVRLSEDIPAGSTVNLKIHSGTHDIL